MQGIYLKHMKIMYLKSHKQPKATVLLSALFQLIYIQHTYNGP